MNTSRLSAYPEPIDECVVHNEVPAVERVRGAMLQSFQTREFAAALLNDLRSSGCTNKLQDKEGGPTEIAGMAEFACTYSEITLRILEEIRRYLLG